MISLTHSLGQTVAGASVVVQDSSIGLDQQRRRFAAHVASFVASVVVQYHPIVAVEVASVFGVGGGWLQNVAISLPLCAGLALFSWWFIKKPFLKVRRYIGAKPSPTHSAQP